MRRLLVVASIALLVTTACSSKKSESESPPSPPPAQLSGPTNNHGTEAAASGKVSVDLYDMYFEPTFITAPPGTKLSVALHNEGKNEHTFTVDAQHVDAELDPEAKMTVTVTVPASGSLVFYCRYHRSMGMQGAVVVKG